MLTFTVLHLMLLVRTAAGCRYAAFVASSLSSEAQLCAGCSPPCASVAKQYNLASLPHKCQPPSPPLDSI